jgi:hypothetical protein
MIERRLRLASDSAICEEPRDPFGKIEAELALAKSDLHVLKWAWVLPRVRVFFDANMPRQLGKLCWSLTRSPTSIAWVGRARATASP